MVTDYSTTVTAWLKLLTDNIATLGISEKSIFEAGSTINFNIPAPCIYLHTDIGNTKVERGFVAELILDFFIVAEGKTNAPEAKAAAVELASKLLKIILDNTNAEIRDNYIEFFAEYANKAIIKMTVIDWINLYYIEPEE